jgi:two-component system sensor histidine kinase PilS (NtrC family)
LKRLEGEIRAKDRMAAVGEMAAGMAHEIRNPLASISGSVGLLRKEVDLTEEQDRLMSIVLHESQRLNKIIDGFLIYSRQITYNPRTVDLNELMDDTVTLLHNNPEVTVKHRIESISGQRPLECHLDPDLIKQVFWNLSHNAIRAMPEGGTLTIELMESSDDEVKIVFRDTGVGIEEDRIDRIFEPFHSSFSNGTGLGLAIVYQIVQAHHGRIEAHSSRGLGSVFEVSLPCRVPVHVQ